MVFFEISSSDELLNLFCSCLKFLSTFNFSFFHSSSSEDNSLEDSDFVELVNPEMWESVFFDLSLFSDSDTICMLFSFFGFFVDFLTFLDFFCDFSPSSEEEDLLNKRSP